MISSIIRKIPRILRVVMKSPLLWKVRNSSSRERLLASLKDMLFMNKLLIKVVKYMMI